MRLLRKEETESEIETPVVPTTAICVEQTQGPGFGEPQGSHLGRSVIAQGHWLTGPPRGEWLLRDGNDRNDFKKALPAQFAAKCQWEKWLVSLVWILEKATPAPPFHHVHELIRTSQGIV